MPDYQMSAWLMAVYLRGMTPAETATLTRIMLESGQQMDLSALGVAVDKHSTGGVGDKTSLILAPLLAASGLIVGKLSGRGLGHTGGTIDKLESIPGFTTELTQEQYWQTLQEVGMSLIGAGPTLAPADRRIYALRDVTATVGSLPLIASSIMSKKLAGGAQHIVLDVKFGQGALMPDIEQARALASAMLSIGRHFQRHMSAVLSDMDQPLGRAVGNSLEVKEAMQVLQGYGPGDVRELVLVLGAELLQSTGSCADAATAKASLACLLDNGQAWEKFVQFVRAQGGDERYLHNPQLLPSSKYTMPVLAMHSGYVAELNALHIGQCAVRLGAGRSRQGETIDYAAGIVLHKKRGESVKTGEQLAVLHGDNLSLLRDVAGDIAAAWQIVAEKPVERPLVADVLHG